MNCSVLFAQPYKSIFGSNSTVWNVSFIGGDWYGTDSLRVTADTVINLYNYKIVEISNLYNIPQKLYVREDTNSGKYYIRNQDDLQNESLFMDISLNVGDTFVIHNSPYFFLDSTAVVDSVKYVNNLKVIKTNLPIQTLDFSQTKYLYFYESVGPSNGLSYIFQSYNYRNGFELICNFRDDTLYFHNPSAFESEFCRAWGGGYVPEFKNSIVKNVYPNPTSSQLNISFNSNYSGTLSIKNLLGQTILVEIISDKTSHQIDVSGFANGLYVISLKSENGVIHSSFIKE